MKLFLTITIAISSVGCGGSMSGRISGAKVGAYCFKAEGVSKYRCYETIDQCNKMVSTIHDKHPWAKIEHSCHQILR